MSLLTLIAVGVGGALGALCRAKATALMKPHFQGLFPVPTFAINCCACFIAGILLAHQEMSSNLVYLCLTMGFLGGFSTLSSMNYEAVSLLKDGQLRMSATYVAATYASTLGAAAVGYLLACVL